MRNRVVIDIRDGDRVIAWADNTPRFLLRWFIRRCARGYGPPLLMTAADNPDVKRYVMPGTIEHFFVAAWEGPR